MSITIATPEQLQELLKPIEYELQELKEKFTLKEPEDWLTREQTATLLQIESLLCTIGATREYLNIIRSGNRT